ncbi:hypothetical protein XENOCAPTIV_026955, partial [Xenoophorus captivus]
SCRPCYVSIVLPATDLHPPGSGDCLLGHYCGVSFHQPSKKLNPTFGLCNWCNVIFSLASFVTLTPSSRFLSTSNEQIYKVFNNSDCPFSRDTCDPKVIP